MEKRELTCIGCPKGCNLIVELNGLEVFSVKGNSCKVGEEYGRKECTHPTRIVTSILKVIGGDIPMVPCKTSCDIPKEKIFDVLKSLKDISLSPPILVGDVLIKNICNTGADIVATREVSKI